MGCLKFTGGPSVRQLKDALFSAKDIKDAEFDVEQMWADCDRSLFDVGQLKVAGWEAADLKLTGGPSVIQAQGRLVQRGGHQGPQLHR